MIDTAAEWALLILALAIGILVAAFAIPVIAIQVFRCLLKGRFYDRAT